MGTVRIKRPKRPTKESRRGLIKKAEPKEIFRMIGSVDRENGEIASVKVVGIVNDVPHTIFKDVVFMGEDSILRKIHYKDKKTKYDSVEVIVLKKWDKYGKIIYNGT